MGPPNRKQLVASAQGGEADLATQESGGAGYDDFHTAH